ncbi:MAG: hypothetical protein Q7R47_01340 [Candidatus Diapherotrites archaeon]|nr:hypothetical protein [Candidatus Diapherotrites archaeon]
MGEGSDYSGSSWTPSYDYHTARDTYTRDASRSYAEAERRGTEDYDLLPESITSQAEHAFLAVLDMTASVSTWPITYRAKALYMDHELRTMYLSEDTDAAFIAFGDARNPTTERFPLQVRPFARGKNELALRLGELVHTNGGGGTAHETSELAALYIARNVHVPNQRRKPIVVFITDEMPYAEISIALARDKARVKLDKAISTKAVFEELNRKFSVYVTLKPYANSNMQPEITKTWENLVGRDRIAHLADEERVVDVTFGMLAHYSGKIEAFKAEIETRQTRDQVRVVYAALQNIFKKPVSDGWSIMPGMGDEGEDVGEL